MDPKLNTAGRTIPVAQTSLGADELRGLADCIGRNHISQGPVVAEFEQEFAAAHGKLYGVACNSGTTALHLALKAAGVSHRQSVAMPTLTMVAVPNAARYCGAFPAFVDSNEQDGNPVVPALRRLADNGAAAVIVPHLYGQPCDFGPTGWPCPVIEDCAEAHYAKFSDGQPVGSRGDFACFSFYGNKIIAAGEGGIVLTNSADAAERMRGLRAHAFTPGAHFNHRELAFGYRMTDLQAAVALAQHRRAGELLRERERVAVAYIASIPALGVCCDRSDKPLLMPSRTFGAVWWVFPLLESPRCPGLAAALRTRLAASGVETRSYFVPMHRQRHLEPFVNGEFPVADDLSARGFYLPLFPGMSDDDVAYIAQIINAVLAERGVL